MANNRKTKPVGACTVIDKVQKILYNKLAGVTEPVAKPGIWQGVTLFGYPRCERLERGKRKTIEYSGPKGEYKEMVSAEGNKFFFTVTKEELTKDFDHWTAEAQLYFIINRKTLKTGVEFYDDSQARTDVITVLNTIGDIKAKAIITDFDKVFEGYAYEMTDDMKPYECFRIPITIFPYKIDDHNCN